MTEHGERQTRKKSNATINIISHHRQHYQHSHRHEHNKQKHKNDKYNEQRESNRAKHGNQGIANAKHKHQQTMQISAIKAQTSHIICIVLIITIIMWGSSQMTRLPIAFRAAIGYWPTTSLQHDSACVLSSCA